MLEFIKKHIILLGNSLLLLVILSIIFFTLNEQYVADSLIARILPLSIIAAGLSISMGIIGAAHILKDK